MRTFDDEAVNRAIEKALTRKATGNWTIREEKLVTEDDGKGGTKAKREVVRKKAAPDLQAMEFWLRERAPERWRGQVPAGKEAAETIRLITQAPRPEDWEPEGGEGADGDNS